MIYSGGTAWTYDFSYEGGYFPVQVESNHGSERHALAGECDLHAAGGAAPRRSIRLGQKTSIPEWIRRLGETGKQCFNAIVRKDSKALGASMNECMKCWEHILPHTVRHPTITVDLVGILSCYQSRYAGAMYSGCRGGFLYVVSDGPVPGGIRVKVGSSEKHG